ncbi:phosphate/phosphite/phosphonate ABC transporter substrate-binding protein [Amycolatopsis sp. NPDC051071]|uniref:phosphate/phosphite/phosphonate ABC transporter substrate-binding protein n=1 Tax=Amycolatopsis sp. NPDC051071 TaxID=3154637 RepID=UPI00343BD788
MKWDARRGVPARGDYMRTARALLMVTALLVTTACSTSRDSTASGSTGNWPQKIVFAATPSGEARTFNDDFGPFVKALSDEVGIRVETFQAADYAGVIEGMIAGTVDVAQLGAFSYALAVQNGAKIEPDGVRIHTKGDQLGYVIYGLAAAGSPISSLGDFRGKTVCFPDPASTTTLIPMFEFDKAGLKVDKDFTRLTIPTGATIPRTVRRGDCAVGLASQAQWETAIRQGDIKQNDLKVVWQVRAPGSPLATRSQLPQDLRDKIRTVVNRLNAEYLEQKGYCSGVKCLISASGDFGYLPVDHSYFQVIWDACKTTHVDSCGSIGGG